MIVLTILAAIGVVLDLVGIIALLLDWRARRSVRAWVVVSAITGSTLCIVRVVMTETWAIWAVGVVCVLLLLILYEARGRRARANTNRER